MGLDERGGRGRRYSLKVVLRYLSALALYHSGVLKLLSRFRLLENGVLVLMFHRVLDDAEFAASSSQPELLVRRSTFQHLLRWLGTETEIIDLRDGLPAWNHRLSSKLRVAITFDDGWLDNLRCVIPSTTQAGIPVTIFVCPGLMGRPFPFWPERVSYLLTRAIDKPDAVQRDTLIEELKNLSPARRDKWIRDLQTSLAVSEFPCSAEPLNRAVSWEEVRGLQAGQAQIASHTLTHCILTAVEPECAALELSESRRQLNAVMDTPCSLLAYPNGNHNEVIRTAAAQAGYKAAFTTQPGLWTASTDLFQIPRVNVFEMKLVSPGGAFSPAMAAYYLFWRAISSHYKTLGAVLRSTSSRSAV